MMNDISDIKLRLLVLEQAVKDLMEIVQLFISKKE